MDYYMNSSGSLVGCTHHIPNDAIRSGRWIPSIGTEFSPGDTLNIILLGELTPEVKSLIVRFHDTNSTLDLYYHADVANTVEFCGGCCLLHTSVKYKAPNLASLIEKIDKGWDEL